MFQKNLREGRCEGCCENADDENTNFYVNLWYFLRIDVYKWNN